MTSLDASSFEECLGDDFNLYSDLEMDWLSAEPGDVVEQNQAVDVEGIASPFLCSYQSSVGFRKSSSVCSYRKRRRLEYIPRVVKHDIRRFYARMLVNVWNSHDPYLFQSLLRTYATKNVKSVQTASGTVAPVRLPGGDTNAVYRVSEFSFHGANLFAKWLGYVQQLVPDQTMRLSNVKIVSSSASDCSVVKFRLTANVTRVFAFERQESSELMEKMVFYNCKMVGNSLIDFECLDQGEDLPVQGTSMAKKVFEPVQTASSDFLVPDISIVYRCLFGKSPVVIQRPCSFSNDVEVTLHINKQREIEQFHFARDI